MPGAVFVVILMVDMVKLVRMVNVTWIVQVTPPSSVVGSTRTPYTGLTA